MKRATVLLLALLLVPAARADAKFSSARVCGPSDCREVDLDGGAHALAHRGSRLPRGAPAHVEASRGVPLVPGDAGHQATRATRSRSRFCRPPDTSTCPPRRRGRGEGWAKLDQHATDVYRRVTTGLEPFPASRLIALGAEDPGSRDASGDAGLPAWTWIAIAAAAAVPAFLTLRRLRRT